MIFRKVPQDAWPDFSCPGAPFMSCAQAVNTAFLFFFLFRRPGISKIRTEAACRRAKVRFANRGRPDQGDAGMERLAAASVCLVGSAHFRVGDIQRLIGGLCRAQLGHWSGLEKCPGFFGPYLAGGTSRIAEKTHHNNKTAARYQRTTTRTGGASYFNCSRLRTVWNLRVAPKIRLGK